MASLTQFAANMKKLGQTIDQNRVTLVQKVAENAGVVVVYATPVDTSRARMNWQGSVDFPISGVLSPYPATPASPAAGPATALKSIRDATASYTGQSGGIWIVNNLDYIGSLNNGSSAQAPANFVAQSVMVAAKTVRKYRLLP